MAKYIDIAGNNIPIRSSNPSNPILGEIWYNTTDNALKAQGFDSVGTWTSGNNINTARQQAADFGVSRDALVFAGGFAPSRSNSTEVYNGSTFSAGGNLNTVVGGSGGAGTATAGLSCGGSQSSPGATGATNQTEEWDGSAWSTVNNMNTAQPYRPATGTQSSTIAAGGAINYSPPSTHTASEQYDGTTWTSTPSLSTGRYAENVGTGASALAIAGQDSPSECTNVVESWDNSSWTSSPATNANHGGHGKTGTSATAALVWAGGNSDPLAGNKELTTESWDGTSWTSLASQANIPTWVAFPQSTGTSTSAISAGGNAPPYTNVTQLFDQGAETQTITSS
jgi:hypothetical protein